MDVIHPSHWRYSLIIIIIILSYFSSISYFFHKYQEVSSPCTLTVSQSHHPCTRNTFIITVGSQQNEPASDDYVRYGDVISLISLPGVGGNLAVTSEKRRPSLFNKSRHSDVTLIPRNTKPDTMGWVLVDANGGVGGGGGGGGAGDGRVRLNCDVCLRHTVTGEQLTVLSGRTLRTPFGLEMEVVARPPLADKTRSSGDFWQIKTSLPALEDSSLYTTLAV